MHELQILVSMSLTPFYLKCEGCLITCRATTEGSMGIALRIIKNTFTGKPQWLEVYTKEKDVVSVVEFLLGCFLNLLRSAALLRNRTC
jgi:hypothetical protein